MADERLIPSGIRDLNTKTFSELIDRLGSIDLTPVLIYLIDRVHPSALPHLAEQFHVTGLEGWEFAKTDDEKRSLIKKAIELHKHKGTPWSIKNSLITVGFKNAEVKEWFQYNGDPYYFRVYVDVSKQGYVDEDLISICETLIYEYKNVRSWLDKLFFFVSTYNQTNILTVSLLGESITIYPYQTTQLSTRAGVPKFIGGHAIDVETVIIPPKGGE